MFVFKVSEKENFNYILNIQKQPLLCYSDFTHTHTHTHETLVTHPQIRPNAFKQKLVWPKRVERVASC